MKRLLLLLLLPFASCNIMTTDPDTGEQVVDLDALYAEIEFAELDLRMGAEMIRATDPESSLAGAVERLADAIGSLRASVGELRDGDGGTLSVKAAALAALDSADELALVITDDPEKQARIRAFAFLAQSLVRRVMFYVDTGG